MNVTIAIDSLKGSLSSLEAGHAIEEGSGVYTKTPLYVRPWPMEGKDRGGPGLRHGRKTGDCHRHRTAGSSCGVPVRGSFRKAAQRSWKCPEPPGSPWYRRQKRIP